MDASATIYSPAEFEQILLENKQLKTENASLKNQLEDNKNEVLKLQRQLHKFADMIFGKKGERYIANPGQLTLGLPVDTETAPACNTGGAKKVSYVKTNNPNKRELHGLGAYMKDLPHVYETREPAHLPEGAIKIGEEEHKTLEHTQGKAYVKVVTIPKYKVPCPNDAGKTLIIAAPAPERPLFKCLACASLLAMILVDKYCDHLPLFRQCGRFRRNGLNLPYNTIVDLNAKTIDLITPLFTVLQKEILAASYMHADETGLKVLTGTENQQQKKSIHGGFLWCYHNSIDNLVFFDYQQGRGEKCTEGILKDFKGFLQTDGWHVYKNVASKNIDIIHICCWAHARRKFVEALPYDKELAGFALKKMGVLYEIEQYCRDQALDYDEIAKLRQKEATPILKDLKEWMTKTYIENIPSSPISGAIGYTLGRWQELSRYVDEGRLKIDNNPVERSTRPVAPGRKNFLFAGSHKGAERLAIIYSLTVTCIINNIDPYEWLTDVIGKINNTSMTRLHELLPHNWKKYRPESVAAEPIEL